MFTDFPKLPMDPVGFTEHTVSQKIISLLVEDATFFGVYPLVNQHSY